MSSTRSRKPEAPASSSPRILDADTIGEPDGFRTETARRTARYLIPLMRQGPEFFIDNARVRMLALTLDDLLLPLVIADGARGNSNVCSPGSHYIDYAQAELTRFGPPLLGPLLGSALSLLGISLKCLGLDRVVYVNNFLWTTNPWPELSRAQLDAITRHLATAYPDHAIVLRSINPDFQPGLARALTHNGYETISSRKVYLFDGLTGDCMKRGNLLQDMKLLRKGSYEIIEDDRFARKDVESMTRFYRDLYLGKYPTLNPQFNERFFELIWREGILAFDTLRRNGTLVGFTARVVDGGRMIGCGIGYDMSAPRRDGLYRRLMAQFIKRAVQQKLLLNLSGGAGQFKMLRGGRPTIECDAVYHAHLPVHRRLPWLTLRTLFTETAVGKARD